MTYSLTDKLNFDDPPKVEIKGKTLTISNNATTVLQLMDIVQNAGEIAGAKAIIELLFDEKDRKTIDELGLSIGDYITFCSVCMELACGNDPDANTDSVQ